MRLDPRWTARLADGLGSPADRLVDALATDILDGHLETGSRLPPHRALAAALGIGVGTATKAYAVLERRGLVRGVKGSGTFVALVQMRRGPLIDLARNTPPAVMTERLLSRTLAAMAKRVDSGLFNDYPPPAGHDEYRRLLARWFADLGMDADPRRLVLTSGAHHAVSVALAVACGKSGTVFTEAHTYPGALALAHHLDLPVVGVSMDDEGLLPVALDRALAKARSRRAVVYVTPTMQNPTTTTMGRARREEIVAVCRAREVTIIEDDVYTLTNDDRLPPLAMLAPERTLYVNSLSKTLNPTLRLGGLVAPPAMYDAVVSALEATAIMVSPLSCAFLEQWVIDGTADAVRRSIRSESERRTKLARELLGSRMLPQSHQGYHVWLPMRASEAQRLAQAARTLGVLVTPPTSTAATSDEHGGVRLCLGPPSMSDLSTALSAVSRLQMEELRGPGRFAP